MLKFVVLIAAIVLLAWVWAAFRRRLKLAFNVAAVFYGIAAVVRLAYVGINEDRLLELALVTLAFLACWLLIWVVTTFLARRRKARPKPVAAAFKPAQPR